MLYEVKKQKIQFRKLRAISGTTGKYTLFYLGCINYQSFDCLFLFTF